MADLRRAIIRLAREIPWTRPYLIPVLRRDARMHTSPTQEGARDMFQQYKDEHPATKKTPQDFYEPPKGDGGGSKVEAPKKPARKPLVTEAEKALPRKALQRDKTKEAVYASARVAHEHQLDWLDRGSGIDSTLGVKAIRADKGETPDLSKPGPVVIIAPLKGEKRATEKIETEEGGDWSRLTDVVRATIAVDTLDDLHSLMDTLRESGMEMAAQPQDRFSEPSGVGYRDMMLRVRHPNGHVSELQLHVKPILAAKEEGHRHYEKVRGIAARAKAEGRTKMTEEEEQVVLEANEAQRRIYDAAWAKATGGSNSGSQKTAATEPRKTIFFNFDGVPSKWEYRKFPVKMVRGKPIVVYDLYNFFTNARKISEAEFKKLQEKSSTE